MDISKLSKAKVLATLYNGSKPQGMGFLHFNPVGMTEEQAQELLDSGQTYFDYVQGRVMKIDLSSNELNTDLYNRDNGEGAAEARISKLPNIG